MVQAHSAKFFQRRAPSLFCALSSPRSHAENGVGTRTTGSGHGEGITTGQLPRTWCEPFARFKSVHKDFVTDEVNQYHEPSTDRSPGLSRSSWRREASHQRLLRFLFFSTGMVPRATKDHQSTRKLTAPDSLHPAQGRSAKSLAAGFVSQSGSGSTRHMHITVPLQPAWKLRRKQGTGCQESRQPIMMLR